MNMKAPWITSLFQKKMLVILMLGFASGLPLGLTGSTLQAWFAMDGVNIVTIGFLGLVGQPYVYKFIWSPLLDKWRLPYLGLRRGWMFSAQLALICFLVIMAMLNPSQQPYLLASMALCFALCSATQDIALDAYRTEILTAAERGMGTAMAVGGYRVAMLVSGSLTLILAHYIGFSMTYLLMALCMGIGIVATLWAKEPVHYQTVSPNFLLAFIAPFKEFFSRRHALALLAFIVLYKLGDAFASTLTTAFLLRGVGFTLVDIGLIYKTVGLGATLLGIFIGGVMMMRMGLFKSLLWFGIIQALTNFFFFALALVGTNYPLMVSTIFCENFGGGLGTAAFMALVMSLCDKRFTATQFALISSLAAVGRVFVGPIAGVMVESVGWAEFFVWTVIFSVPGLIMLFYLKTTIQHYEANQGDDEREEAISEAKATA